MWPLIPPAVLSAEEQSTCKGFIDSVASELWKLQPPPNCEHNPWTGPFDQLVSCAYALMQAENRGFHARPTDNYFEDVLAKIVELLREQKAEASESDALNNYLSSFYFNAGIQRLTFAAERLLAAFVGVYCICGKEPMIVGNRTPAWDVLLGYVRCRLEHSHFDFSMPNLRKMLSCAHGWDKLNCDRDKCIAIWREQVNPKKHGIYDHARILASRPKMPDGKPWLPTDQFFLAAHGFKTVREAYSEVVAWNPTPKKQ